MGKGVERERQEILFGAGFQQIGWLFKAGGCGSGTKTFLHLPAERKEGQKRMDGYGGDDSPNGRDGG